MSNENKATASQALSVSEFSHAMSVSEATIRRMIKRGEIKSFLFGQQRRIPAAELDRLVSGAA